MKLLKCGDNQIFTNEFEGSDVITTILDETAELEDIEILFTDDYVHIRQFTEKSKMYPYQVVTLTHMMYLELIKSYEQSEGMFYTDFDQNNLK